MLGQGPFLLKQINTCQQQFGCLAVGMNPFGIAVIVFQKGNGFFQVTLQLFQYFRRIRFANIAVMPIVQAGGVRDIPEKLLQVKIDQGTHQQCFALQPVFVTF